MIVLMLFSSAALAEGNSAYSVSRDAFKAGHFPSSQEISPGKIWNCSINLDGQSGGSWLFRFSKPRRHGQKYINNLSQPYHNGRLYKSYRLENGELVSKKFLHLRIDMFGDAAFDIETFNTSTFRATEDGALVSEISAPPSSATLYEDHGLKAGRLQSISHPDDIAVYYLNCR